MRNIFLLQKNGALFRRNQSITYKMLSFFRLHLVRASQPLPLVDIKTPHRSPLNGLYIPFCKFCAISRAIVLCPKTPDNLVHFHVSFHWLFPGYSVTDGIFPAIRRQSSQESVSGLTFPAITATTLLSFKFCFDRDPSSGIDSTRLLAKL